MLTFSCTYACVSAYICMHILQMFKSGSTVSPQFCSSFTPVPGKPTKVSSYTCKWVYWVQNRSSHPFHISNLSIFSPIIAQITTYCSGGKIALVSWKERDLPSQMTPVAQSIFLMDYIKMRALTDCTLTLKNFRNNWVTESTRTLRTERKHVCKPCIRQMNIKSIIL